MSGFRDGYLSVFCEKEQLLSLKLDTQLRYDEMVSSLRAVCFKSMPAAPNEKCWAVGSGPITVQWLPCTPEEHAEHLLFT